VQRQSPDKAIDIAIRVDQAKRALSARRQRHFIAEAFATAPSNGL
jgi:hypothetical protein